MFRVAFAACLIFAFTAFSFAAPPVLGRIAPGDTASFTTTQPKLPKADGYRGIWYSNQKQDNEYAFKYSGGMGTYCAKHRPLAIYVPEVDKTFFCYGGTDTDNSTLYHMVSYYDHKTGMVPRPTILLDKKTTDAHDNPVISIDDDGYIWIFSSSHGTSRPSYISVSTRPYSIDAFERVMTTNFSYTQPFHLKGKGFVFPHTIYLQGRRAMFFTHSADGRTWSEPRLISLIQQGHYQVCEPFEDQKIASSFNYHPNGRGLNWRTNLYYIESGDLGETWQTVAGDVLDLPLRQCDNPALVHDYASEGLNVYLKDLTFDKHGNPIILYVTSTGWQAGPKNDPRLWNTARWTGSDWDIQGSIQSDSNYDMGSLYVEDDDTWRLIAPTDPGPQPYNPGGEVVMWTSTDRGHHWRRFKQLTINSDRNQTYVRRPLHAKDDFYAFWADGNGRHVSESYLYFTNKTGDHVWRLPVHMQGDFARPELVKAPDKRAVP